MCINSFSHINISQPPASIASTDPLHNHRNPLMSLPFKLGKIKYLSVRSDGFGFRARTNALVTTLPILIVKFH